MKRDHDLRLFDLASLSVGESDDDPVVGQSRHKIPSAGQEAFHLFYVYDLLICPIVRH